MHRGGRFGGLCSAPLGAARLPVRRSTHACEIDEAALHVRVQELHANRVADVESLEALHQASFGERLRDAHPRALVGGPGDHGIELLADARLQQQRRGGFAYLTLDFRGVALLLGTMQSERA